MSNKVRVTVPATIANLGPGFDTLGLAIDLRNELEIEPAASGFTVEVEGEGRDILKDPEENLVIRALGIFSETTGLRLPGLRLRLVNRIPLARGLGSSSAAIVAGLVGINAMMGSPLGKEELLSLACRLEGHPDNIAPALLGGLVVSVTLDGSRVLAHSIKPPQGLDMVLAIPDFHVATRRAREILPRSFPLGDVVFNMSRAAMLVAKFLEGDFGDLGALMEDRLHQPYRSELVPGMEEAFLSARKAGALAVVLSGSGPSVAAFVARESPNSSMPDGAGEPGPGLVYRKRLIQIGRAMVEAFAARGVRANFLITVPSAQGAVMPDGQG